MSRRYSLMSTSVAPALTRSVCRASDFVHIGLHEQSRRAPECAHGSKDADCLLTGLRRQAKLPKQERHYVNIEIEPLRLRSRASDVAG